MLSGPVEFGNHVDMLHVGIKSSFALLSMGLFVLEFLSIMRIARLGLGCGQLQAIEYSNRIPATYFQPSV